MKETEKITSRDNRRLVHARKVRDGRIAEQIFIEGRRLAKEALRSGIELDECFVTESFDDGDVLDMVSQLGVSIANLPDRIFGSIADTKQSQGIILIGKRPASALELIEGRLKRSRIPIVVFLEAINNPSNLGAILRTAEAADAAGVIVSKNSADVFSPKALRSAMGSAFRLAVFDHADLWDILRWARSVDLVIMGASANGDKSYLDIEWNIPRLLILGSEAHGLSESDMKQVDEVIRIPMDKKVESLNLAVSCGIFLFEAKRQIG